MTKVISQIAEINETELAARIAMACLGLVPPANISGQGVFDQLNSMSTDPDMVEGFKRAAKAAIKYWKECIDSAKREQ